MTGHGSPSDRGRLPARRFAPGLWGVALVGLALAAPRASAAEEGLRIRVSFGGGAPRQWQATVSVPDGRLSDARPLGMEPDAPGSMWIDESRLEIRQRGPRSYDGFDVEVVAPPESKLQIRLAAEADTQPLNLAIPLREIDGLVDRPLDAQGNRVLIHRSPGDTLRVRFDRPHLIFEPGESFAFDVEPRLGSLDPKKDLVLRAKLVPARGSQELWTHQCALPTNGLAPIEVPLPGAEGVYDVVLSAHENAGWAGAVRRPLGWNKPLAERRVQLVVLAPERPQRATGGTLNVVLSIDPANPRWAELLNRLPQLARLPRLWKGPLGNGRMDTWRHALGPVARLAPSAQSPDLSWEAYPLPLGSPGKPFVLEVQYPSDVEQTLGISVLEPDASGALMPVGLDSGVIVEREPLQPTGPPRWLKHRMVFWPRTGNPILLMTNRRPDTPACYGEIRVLGGWENLPENFPAREGRGEERLLAAYFDRPMFPENFSAGEALDPWSGHSLDDWVTFYQGATRLIEYARYAGHNAVILSVLADGSTLFPADALRPNPRYDKGALWSTGQDPIRKDVVELVLRICDREGIRVIPALDLNAPLPALETILRLGGAEAAGLRWIGPGGVERGETSPVRRAAADYNLLDPRVQQAVVALVGQLASRYAAHASLSGVALQLSADGWAQLPGPQWGMDDATIARFEQDTGIRLPGDGPERFSQRAEALGGPHLAAWLRWRAQRMAEFHAAIQAELQAVRPDTRLYLLAAGSFADGEAAWQFRPVLGRRAALADALLTIGIDPARYVAPSAPVLLRATRLSPPEDLAARAAAQELGQMADVDRLFQAMATPGSLFFHKPQETRLASFDQRSPITPSFTFLAAELSASGAANRRRFVHALATLDAQVIADGGRLLPLGQEDAAADVIALYRRLPPVRFESFGESAPSSSPLVCFRKAVYSDRLYAYVANNSPLSVTARVAVESPPGCTMEELTGRRQIAPPRREADGTWWTVELRPYDAVGVRFARADVVLSRPRAALPESAESQLAARIRDLGLRAASLRRPAVLPVPAGGDFETPSTPDEPVPGWAVTQRPGVSIRTTAIDRHAGRQCAEIVSSGPIACLVSRPFAAPPTGRLAMAVWLRKVNEGNQPPLRLAFEGKFDGQDYYRYAAVGAAEAGGGSGVPIPGEWTQYWFQVSDLPLEQRGQMRVRFDLMGAGEVRIDDVQLFDLAFNEKELRELAKLITLAEYHLQNRQIGDCLRLLDGYWPRFLEGFVSAPAGEMAQSPAAAASPGRSATAPPPAASSQPGEEASPRTGLLDRLKDLLPKSDRF